MWTSVCEDLQLFGERIHTQIDNLGRKAELDPPRLRYIDTVAYQIQLVWMI
jgi:hypothetical protein